MRLDAVAQAEGISANFLVQIMNDLKKAHIVTSRRGKAGGYLLERDPETILLSEIIIAIEPSFLHYPLSREGESAPLVSHLWSQLAEKLESHLSEMSLKQLAQKEEEPMYFI